MKNASYAIGRLVTSGRISDNSEAEYLRKSRSALASACRFFANKNLMISTLITPAGFVSVEVDLSGFASGVDSRDSDFNVVSEIAEIVVNRDLLDSELKDVISAGVENITLSVDVCDSTAGSEKRAELVGTYNTKKSKFVHWTGKSYPTSRQEKTLIYCRNLQSHFQEISGRRVLVLGCHDINIFSPRARSLCGEGTYKASLINDMQQKCDEFMPEVVLHHPHSTHSVRVWGTAWSGVRKSIGSANIGASAINYQWDPMDNPQPLDKILTGTAFGNVVDYILQG